MGFRDWIDDIGMGVGFLAGGAPGAALGRTLGGVAQKGTGTKFKDLLMDAGVGYGAGSVASGIGLDPLGGPGLPEPAIGMADSMGVAGNAAGAAPAVESGGGFLGGVKSWLGDLEPAQQAALLGQGIGAAGDIYGTYQQGKMMDEDRERRRRVREYLSPRISEWMNDL